MSDKPLAEKAATWERPIGSDPRDDVTPPPADPDVVGEDTFIARPDLGTTMPPAKLKRRSGSASRRPGSCSDAAPWPR